MIIEYRPGRRNTDGVLFGDYIRGYIRSSTEMMTAIRQGVADCKAGRVKSWRVIKQELGL